MDVDATQVIDDINFDVAEESRRDGSPVGFLKLLKQKNFEEKLFPIFEGVNRVGRDVACHVTLDSKTLSKEHCCIEVIADNHFIYDLGSANKSRRNMMVLLPNVRYELNNDDRLTLADLKFVYNKSLALPVGDSGSDTESLPESESMLQVSGDGVGVAFEPQAADDDDDDDDDPSSDILQPTQHAGAHLIGLHNKMDAFVEDSFRHVTSEKKEKESFADETVLETPPRVLFGANCGDDFVPESDSESEAATQNFFEPTTLEYDKRTEREVRSRAVASDEPTQTYSMDFVNETIAVEHNRSGSQPKSASFIEESPVRSDADIAPTQVFDDPVQKFGMDSTPPAEVSPQFTAKKPSSSTSSLQLKTIACKDTRQESIACNSDVEETQVVEETAFAIAGGDCKAAEKLGVTQVTMQTYVEETLLYEDEATAVVEVRPLIDKRQSQKDKAVVRESDGSVINFSPQSASTQVFCTDAETSFLPTLVLETSDQLDADDNDLVPPPLPLFPSAAVALSSKAVRCTGLNSERSRTSADDVCTQVFGGKEVGQISVELPSADDLCTQVYEDIDWQQLGGSDEAVAKSSVSTDDICTQVYQDRDVIHGGDSGAATDNICSQDCSTNRSSNVALKRLEPVSSTTYPRATDPSTSISIQDASLAFDANRIPATTETVDLNEISAQGVSTNFLPTLPYQAELFTVESKGIRSLVSESAIPLTVDDRDSDNTDELSTEVLDILNVVQKSKGKRRKEAAQPNAEYLPERKRIQDSEDSVDSEVSASWSATKKNTNLKQGKNSKLSSRRSSLIHSKGETIALDEERKGHSSNDSDQPCSDFSGKKRNEKSEQEISKDGNVAERVGGKPVFAEKVMNSDVSDDSRKSDDVYSNASGRRVSMRQNKGKRPEDNEFLKPSEEKRKNKKGSKRQAEELQQSGAESSSTPTCSDLEETPLISKSSSSERLDSQSARGSRSCEIVDSSQMSDDDLPSLASLVALNRVQCSATRNTLSKGHEPRSAITAEVENVQPVGESESGQTKGVSIDVTEDEIMKKESGNVKKTHWESERNQRTETKMLSKEDSTVEGDDPATCDTTKKEPRTLKRMSLGSKKSQAAEKTVVSEDVLFKEKNYLKKPGNKKKMGVDSKMQRIDETTKMHSEDDNVAEQAKADGGRSCDLTSERDLSEVAVDVKVGQKTSRRLAGRQKQVISDSATDDNAELNEKNGGHQRLKNAKKPTMKKSVAEENEERLLEVVVRSDETGSSKKSHLSSAAKGDSKLSSDFDIESVPSTSSDHSDKGRRGVRTAVTSSDNEAAVSTRGRSSKQLAANTDSNDKIAMDNDTANLESKTSGRKSRVTLAADVNVVKEAAEEVPKRSRLRKKSLGTHVAEVEDDVTSEEVKEDLQKAEQLQPLRELEETKRTANTRKKIAECEFSTLSLKKKVKTDDASAAAAAAAAAADSTETEDEKVNNSDIKLLTSAKKSHRTGTVDLADEGVVVESSKELERKRLNERKSFKGVSAAEVIDDDHDVQKLSDVKKSMTRKSCRGLFTENDSKAMRKLSGSESSSSSLGKMSDRILQTEDADEKDERPESKLSTRKTNRKTVAAEKNVDVVEGTVTEPAKPVRVETGSRRVKKTELKGVEEELPNERHEAAQEATVGKRNSRNLTTSQLVVSIEKPQLPVVEEDVEKASDQRLEGTGRKRKKYNTLNENDEKDVANVKIDLGVDSKRLRISGKPVKDDHRGNENSSHLKPNEQVATTPDFAKGARRRTKSGLEPVIKPKVMFTGVVDENGQKTVKSLGGEMVESIYDCTHLVTDQVRRTVKFLCGVARGLSIVSPLWLDDSRSEGRFLEPECFLIVDVENEKKFNFRLHQTLKDAAKRPLLQGLSIHVTENVRPDPTQMKDVDSIPDAEAGEMRLRCSEFLLNFVPELPRSFEENLIIVTCEGKDLESCRRSEELGIPLVSSEYIMTGILQHRLDANLFRLTTKKTPETSKRNKPETLPGSRKKPKK